ncbi:MAG: hypothetical protein LBS89_04605 [Zoogloeaceae bacterium]|nr:hypothetical protein [Zoogloeaceae bacterium]
MAWRTYDRTAIWSMLLGLQSHRRVPFQWRVALETTNNSESMFSGSSGSYRYTSLSGYMLIPLR